ncbi:hypothetical protein HK104_010546 [Borealophlyctis nickersoniae]|nr:hypothetical protein HK104_010546 [Borealophlyctis nickersoniae]
MADLDPHKWSIQDVLSWLDSVKLSDLQDVFSENHIDGDVLLAPEFDDHVLKNELAITAWGTRQKLKNARGKLRPKDEPVPLPEMKSKEDSEPKRQPQHLSRTSPDPWFHRDLEMGTTPDASPPAPSVKTIAKKHKPLCRPTSALRDSDVYFGSEPRRRDTQTEFDIDNFLVTRKTRGADQLPFHLKKAVQSKVKRLLCTPATLHYADEEGMEKLRTVRAFAIWQPPLGKEYGASAPWVRLFKQEKDGRVIDLIDNSGRFSENQLDRPVRSLPTPMIQKSRKVPTLIKGHGYYGLVVGGYGCQRSKYGTEDLEDGDEVLPLYGESDHEDYISDSEWEAEQKEELKAKKPKLPGQRKAPKSSNATPAAALENVESPGATLSDSDDFDGSGLDPNRTEEILEDFPLDCTTGRRVRQSTKPPKPSTRRVLTLSEIRIVIDQYIQAFTTQWKERTLPRLAAKAYSVWHREREVVDGMRKAIEDLDHRRIPNVIEIIEDEKFSTVKEVEKRCKALDGNLENKLELQWKVEVCRGDEPPLPEPKPRKPREGENLDKLRQRDGSDAQSYASDDSMGDFIVSDEEVDSMKDFIASDDDELDAILWDSAQTVESAKEGNRDTTARKPVAAENPMRLEKRTRFKNQQKNERKAARRLEAQRLKAQGLEAERLEAERLAPERLEEGEVGPTRVDSAQAGSDQTRDLRAPSGGPPAVISLLSSDDDSRSAPLPRSRGDARKAFVQHRGRKIRDRKVEEKKEKEKRPPVLISKKPAVEPAREPPVASPKKSPLEERSQRAASRPTPDRVKEPPEDRAGESVVDGTTHQCAYDHKTKTWQLVPRTAAEADSVPVLDRKTGQYRCPVCTWTWKNSYGRKCPKCEKSTSGGGSSSPAGGPKNPRKLGLTKIRQSKGVNLHSDSEFDDDDGDRPPKRRAPSSTEEEVEEETIEVASGTAPPSIYTPTKISPLKKRRRVRDVSPDTDSGLSIVSTDDQESNEDDYESLGEARARQKGRKNIKAIRPEKDETKALRAGRAEQIKAIEKRAAKQMRKEGRKSSGQERKRIIVNLGHEDSEQTIYIKEAVATWLKDHQIEGIRFMWRNIIMIKHDTHDGGAMRHAGCVLAHAMGLGKTLQVIVFVSTLLKQIRKNNPAIPEHLKPGRILIVLPPALVANWIEEFREWLGDEIVPGYFTGTSSPEHRLKLLRNWHDKGNGVFLIGYEMLRTLTKAKDKDAKEDAKQPIQTAEEAAGSEEYKPYYQKFRELLLDGPSLVVCDEGHTIKNRQSQVTSIMNQFKTNSRLILTGYPLQNNLQEYWCMVDFVAPMFLGTLQDFKNMYTNPIENGMWQDSTDADRKLSGERLYVLQKLLDPLVLRCDATPLKNELPPKHEFLICGRMTPLQRETYLAYLDSFDHGSGYTADGAIGRSSALMHVCNHPWIFKEHLRQQREKALRAVNKPARNRRKSVGSGGVVEVAKPQRAVEVPAADGATKALVMGDGLAEDEGSAEPDVDPAVLDRMYPVFDAIFSKYSEAEASAITQSVKAMVVAEIVQTAKAAGEKVLLFTRSLDTIEYFIQYFEKEKPSIIRGDVSPSSRQALIKSFNESAEAVLFIISTKSGSVGVNIPGANRVILYDSGWNPSEDEQAIGRAYRYGQTRPVFVYRLQICDTFEAKMFMQCVKKVGLASNVIDKKTTERHFTKEQIKLSMTVPVDCHWSLTAEEESEVLQVGDPVIQSILAKWKDRLVRVDKFFLAEVDDNLTAEEAQEREQAFLDERKRRKFGRKVIDGPGVVAATATTPQVTTGETAVPAAGEPASSSASTAAPSPPPTVIVLD